ncbi:hypothetical protein Zm00014a_034988 [Zea mays]|uniref:Uncharacterized protein n=1 Tax=Zea mays TaxID=4577 RepID=A0A3L6DLZ1_MAIZE|nr:hypothetical protein Zm00014a_034988 [Zea mays]
MRTLHFASVGVNFPPPPPPEEEEDDDDVRTTDRGDRPRPRPRAGAGSASGAGAGAAAAGAGAGLASPTETPAQLTRTLMLLDLDRPIWNPTLASICADITWDFLDLSAAAWTGSMVDAAVDAAARMTVVLPAGCRNPGTTASPTSAPPEAKDTAMSP